MSEAQPIPNTWGLHQPRITVHSDGSLRALYLKNSNTGQINWRVLRRSATAGTWSLEASGESQDDATLMRDPVSDLAHVVAWPNSVPVAYSSPAYAGRIIPGNWQQQTASSRHYGNTGMGSDGKLCLKASRELPVSVPTSSAQTQIICGQHLSEGGYWNWGAQITVNTGARKAYDYLFPGGLGLPQQLAATSQWDLYKTAAGAPLLSNAAGNYVFNGVHFYSTDMASASGWQSQDLVAPRSIVQTATEAPVVRQTDAYIDRRARTLITYWVDDPLQPADRGLYFQAHGASGTRLFGGRLSALPPYGFARVFDDSMGRLWLLWTNLGSQMSQVWLYRLQQAGDGVLLSDRTDLSAQFAPYAIQGSPFLAVPRGGQVVDKTLDGLFGACDATFTSGRLADCYPNGPNRQRVVHFRLALPSN